jgi:hypothetical protein
MQETGIDDLPATLWIAVASFYAMTASFMWFQNNGGLVI